MRLIDADKITFFDCLAKTGNGVCCHAEGIVSKSTIEMQPTIEAIPIEWIKKYIEDNTYEMVNPKYVDDTYNYIQFTEKPFDYNLIVMPFQVKMMLDDWEEENEID